MRTLRRVISKFPLAKLKAKLNMQAGPPQSNLVADILCCWFCTPCFIVIKLCPGFCECIADDYPGLRRSLNAEHSSQPQQQQMFA
jgi:hypothetical protein